MKRHLIEDKLKERETLQAALMELEEEIEGIQTEADNKKVLVEKLPVHGFSLAFKNSGNESRLVVHLTEDETKEMIKEILADVEDFTFVLSPLANELDNVFKDFQGMFKNQTNLFEDLTR